MGTKETENHRRWRNLETLEDIWCTICVLVWFQRVVVRVDRCDAGALLNRSVIFFGGVRLEHELKMEWILICLLRWCSPPLDHTERMECIQWCGPDKTHIVRVGPGWCESPLLQVMTETSARQRNVKEINCQWPANAAQACQDMHACGSN